MDPCSPGVQSAPGGRVYALIDSQGRPIVFLLTGGNVALKCCRNSMKPDPSGFPLSARDRYRDNAL